MKQQITTARLSLLAILAGCAALHPVPQFGVVAQTPTHGPCVVLPAPVPVGQRITIAKLRPPEFVLAAIGNPTSTCGVGLAPGHAYELAIPAGQSGWWASTAVVGDVPRGVTFKECTGTESVQLTAWRGEKRIWHDFYYVDYEMEPSCDPDEIAD